MQVGDLQAGKSIVDDSELQSEAIFKHQKSAAGLNRPKKQKVLLDLDEEDEMVELNEDDPEVQEVKKRKLKERQKRQADKEIE